MKSLIPPLIEPDSGPPNPPCPIDAAAAAAEPLDDREEDEEDDDAVDALCVEPLPEEELLPNRLAELPLKPPLLLAADPPDEAEAPEDELESEDPIVRPAVAEVDELEAEELDEDEDPPCPPCPPGPPPLSPPPPPPVEVTCTVIPRPPPPMDTLTVPPRPPRNCGTMSDENFSGTVTPVSRIVCWIRSLVAETVLSEGDGPPPGPPVEG
jgi:hypothetical protein